MDSRALPLQNKGIYHNLPTFSTDIKDLEAIITGANGISGFATLRVLLESPQRWKKIWTLSRNPPPEKMMNLLTSEQRSRVEHVPVDFLAQPEDIASALVAKHVAADYIFFYSYMQPRPKAGKRPWSNAQDLVEVNETLLRNFLSALRIASVTPKRFLLQTGAKNYGGQLGPTLTPAVESAPRVNIEPNFYYGQEDLLFQYCRETGANWNVIRPSWIIGAVTSAQMNAFYGVGVYAAVQAHLGKPLNFPGDVEGWLRLRAHSTAILTGYLSEWAVLQEHCSNQAFNASDSASFSSASLWPELARWYGISDVGKPELDSSKIHNLETPYQPPPLGYGPPCQLGYSWSFASWAQLSENHEAWKKIMAEHNLSHDPFQAAESPFQFSDMATWANDGCLSYNKARLMGWSGFVDTTQAIFEAFEDMVRLGMLPPLRTDGAKPGI